MSKFCIHDGENRSFYRVNPKGTQGVFWCAECIRQYGMDACLPGDDLAQLCEILANHSPGCLLFNETAQEIGEAICDCGRALKDE